MLTTIPEVDEVHTNPRKSMPNTIPKNERKNENFGRRRNISNATNRSPQTRCYPPNIGGGIMLQPIIDPRLLHMQIMIIQAEILEAEEKIEKVKRTVNALYHVLGDLPCYQSFLPQKVRNNRNVINKPECPSSSNKPDVIINIPTKDSDKEAKTEKEKVPRKTNAEEKPKQGRRHLFGTPIFVMLLVFIGLFLIWIFLYNYLNYGNIIGNTDWYASGISLVRKCSFVKYGISCH